MIATFVPVGTEAGAPPGLMSRLRQAGEAAGPPGEKRRGFDWRVGGLADRRYKYNVGLNWRGTGLGAHGHEYFMRFMSRVAASRRGRRPSRDNYCAFDGGTIVAGSCESHNYRENDWRVGGLADRRYKYNVSLNWRGTGLGAHGHEYFMRFMSRVAASRRDGPPSRIPMNPFSPRTTHALCNMR